MTILNDGRLHLFGAVGGDFPGEPGFSSEDVRAALEEYGDGPLVVHVNSGGGYATEGAAIHAMLSRRKGGVDIVVEGIAASAASLICMAGKTVTMAAGSVLMIHDPAATTSGDSAAHAQSIAGLEALATAYAGVYARKSGKTAEACRAIMRAETWYSPEEAVAAGFADRVGTMRAVAMASFRYDTYAKTPVRVRQSARLQIVADVMAEINARNTGKSIPKPTSDHPLAAHNDNAAARRRGMQGLRMVK